MFPYVSPVDHSGYALLVTVTLTNATSTKCQKYYDSIETFHYCTIKLLTSVPG